MKKALGIVFSAVVAMSAFTADVKAAPALSGLSKLHSNDVVQVRRGRNAAAALGLLGGVALGAAIASSDRRSDYDCDQWGNCYSRGHYSRPSRSGLIWNEDKDCWVRRGNYWGPCRAY